MQHPIITIGTDSTEVEWPEGSGRANEIFHPMAILVEVAGHEGGSQDVDLDDLVIAYRRENGL